MKTFKGVTLFRCANNRNHNNDDNKNNNSNNNINDNKAYFGDFLFAISKSIEKSF